MIPLIPSLLILLASIAVVYRKTPARLTAWLVSTAFLVLMLINGFYYVADYFTGNGIDESVIFHIRVGLDGSGFAEYTGLTVSVVLYIAASLGLCFLLYRLIRSRGQGVSLPWLGVTSVLLPVAFMANPAARELYVLSTDAMHSDRSVIARANFPDEYLSRTPTIRDRKNIVYVYLEGVEQTYLDENLFPGLMPNIRELRESSTRFTDIRQLTHTGWTIAGMVASQCGIPLFSPSDGNSLSGLDQFLPQANCLGDILKENGYHLSYMGGADTEFAGKGNFYRSHGFDSVKGRDDLSRHLEDPGYLSGWGLYDDSLFSLLEEEYLELSRQDSPFGLFTLTLDTHHPDGHLSKACEGTRYADGSNPILNSVHCTDRLVRNLVDFIRENPSDNGTVIVITSDHYAMRNTASALLSRGKRRNLAFFIDDRSDAVPREIQRRGSMLDIAPTLLSFLGTEVDGLAFGRSLLSGSPTLYEQNVTINRLLNDNRNVVNHLWDYPQLDDGIQYHPEQEDQLALGDRRITMPAILTINDDRRVDRIFFDHSGQTQLTEYLASMRPGQHFLWADQCGVVRAFSRSHGSAQGGDGQWCIASGTVGADSMHLREVDDTPLSRHEILATLSMDGNVSAARHEQRLARISSYTEYGLAPVATVSSTSGEGGPESVFVRSSGYGAGASYIEKNGIEVHLTRGLTLVGLADSRPPVRLGHYDSCEGTVTDSGALDATGDFRSLLEEHRETFDTFVVVGHDSVICSDPALPAKVLSGLGLHEWRDVAFREPYIVVLPAGGDGESGEWSGHSEQAIGVELTGFSRDTNTVTQRSRDRLERIAHAGAGYDGRTYTNSLDALDHNRERYSLFEIDFSWTSDGELVCLHDWGDSFQRSFGQRTDSPLSLSEFRHLVAERPDLRKCTLESLAAWMNRHPEERIVTDIKERNVEALQRIAARYPGLRDRFIPQVYQPDEYHAARLLGFEDVIWTLYRFSGDRDAVLAALEQMDLYALTMPPQRAEAGLARAAHKRRGVLSYVHTINSEAAHRRFSALGVAEIYTDWLHPER